MTGQPPIEGRQRLAAAYMLSPSTSKRSFRTADSGVVNTGRPELAWVAS